MVLAACGTHPLARDADAVVLDPQDNALADVEPDERARRACVADDVRETFLHDAVDGKALDVAERALDATGECDLGRIAAAVVVDELFQRRLDAELVERGRAQLHGETAEFRQGIGGLVANGEERLLHIFIRGLVGERAQGEQERGQRLPGLVVQLHRDALALLLLRGDDVADQAGALARAFFQMLLHAVHGVRETSDLVRCGERDAARGETPL